jgi:hypothetical protein
MVVRRSLLTIAAMLALGYTTRYSGLDAILGLAFARTGVLYPFFGTLLGWMGVALTGSDTSSNVLFGSLQKITAEQIGHDHDPEAGRQREPGCPVDGHLRERGRRQEQNGGNGERQAAAHGILDEMGHGPIITGYVRTQPPDRIRIYG